MDVSKRTFLRAAGAVPLLGLPSLAAAQAALPPGPVRVVVPFTAGSATDVVARAVCERLEKALQQPFLVDNRPGAGGTLGAAFVAAAPADGRTLLVHSAAHVANASLYPRLKYDTLRDFAPVAMLATLPNVLVASPTRGYRSVQELVQRAKAQPGTLMYASAGNGSATHMQAEKFRLAAGIEAAHVPYRGTPEALADVMGGRIDWFFAPLVSALPLIRDGKLQALAVTAPERSPVLPQVPTTAEAGFPGADHLFWIGLFAPGRTPAERQDVLHAEITKALGDPQVRERLERLGAQPAGGARSRFAAQVQDEVASAAALIRQAGIRLDS